MSKTIKTALFIIQQKVKIIMLKHRIKKMESISYLDLCERMELRDAINLLQSLELQQQELQNTVVLSLH
ncbi:MAG: hypothetical protein ABI741_10705 [Ferruginibacter sp.]